MTIWAYWFAACFLGFLALETRALWTGRPTLSRTVWALGREYPLFTVLFGVIVGGLLVHFFAGPETCGL